MAITKTVFTGATLAANAPEVLAFLLANAAGYFDTVTADANGNVKCTIDDVDVLILGFDGTQKNTISLLNGTTVKNYAGASLWNGSLPFTTAYTTANGIMLVDNAGGTFIITKTNENTTAIIATMRTTNTQSSANKICIGDPATNSTWFDVGSGAGSAAAARAKYVINESATLTTLTPLPLGDGGTYCPNCFVTPWTENGGITSPKKLIYGGDEYIYDGAFALKG